MNHYKSNIFHKKLLDKIIKSKIDILYDVALFSSSINEKIGF